MDTNKLTKTLLILLFLLLLIISFALGYLYFFRGDIEIVNSDQNYKVTFLENDSKSNLLRMIRRWGFFGQDGVSVWDGKEYRKYTISKLQINFINKVQDDGFFKLPEYIGPVASHSFFIDKNIGVLNVNFDQEIFLQLDESKKLEYLNQKIIGTLFDISHRKLLLKSKDKYVTDQQKILNNKELYFKFLSNDL